MHGIRRRTAITAASAAIATLGAAMAFTISGGPSHAQDCAGYVGLTFDDGPDTATTADLLDALEDAGLRATVFNTGQNAAAEPGLAQAQADAGMWIGNHSWSHPRLTELSREEMTSELSRTQDAIEQATGAAPVLFRPPFGDTDETLAQVAAELGLTQILWDVDSQDWNGATTEQIVQAAATLQDGQVILMHDGYRSTIDAIGPIADDLAARGLCAGMIAADTGRAVAPR